MRRVLRIAARECGILAHNPIYLFCMVLFPLLVVFFFTSMLEGGSPTELPCGIVDLDNTTMTRSIVRKLDATQTSKITHYYNSVNEAREAIQKGDIHGFLYFPKGTTADLLSSRQPTVSFYYSSVTLSAGSMIMRDMKTVTTLAAAGIGAAKLSMLGKSEHEIKTFLQPITIDLHMASNPWASYNVYLTTIFVPGILTLLFTLITTYSIGTELKFKRAQEWMQMAGNNPYIALIGKFLPQTIIFLTMMYGYMWYIFIRLDFPHPAGTPMIAILGLLAVISSQGFGIFMFGLMPSLRMSMSISSLWAVLGISLAGSTFPVFAMHPILEALSWLFPLRHYYMIYQLCIFNGYPLIDAWTNMIILFAFAMLPIIVAGRIRKAMLEYVYIP